MKGVILAAGYGTRFLPGTKTVPKEMFPLINVPVIHLIVDEMIEAGIADILIVTSRRKKALEDYFDREIELESTFAAEGADEKLARIKPIAANIFFLRQRQMAGTGDALLLCEPFVGDSPFVVAYPDDVLLSGPSLAGQLVELYPRTELPVLAGQELPDKDIARYRVVASPAEDAVAVRRGRTDRGVAPLADQRTRHYAEEDRDDHRASPNGSHKQQADSHHRRRAPSRQHQTNTS